jgi:hypothetical protein
MGQRAKFIRFDQCTKEHIECVMESYTESSKELPRRIMDHLQWLDGDFGGFNIDRLQHSLQTATRAYRDDKYESTSIKEFAPIVERVLSQEIAFRRRGGRIPADE